MVPLLLSISLSFYLSLSIYAYSFLVFLLLSVSAVQSQPSEHQHGAEPLPAVHRVLENYDGSQDGEELPGGGDDGTGQGAKGGDCDENESLKKNKVRLLI